ncbi:MAG TPA: prolyl oligopeptidase family serine peptidase [Rhizomicrobium sp.]|jgi:prolyl oligopeptidase
MNGRAAFLAGVLACGAAFAASAPPLPAARPVSETLYGTKVTDPYRYFEAQDAGTIAWIKSEGATARGVLDAIPSRAALLKRMTDFEAGFSAVDSYQKAGTREFYRERAPGADSFDLMVRDAKGVRKLVDLSAIRAANGGKPFAINFFLASPDGTEAAAGISEGGTEAASITVYDAATGKILAGPVDRAELGLLAWSDDSRILYFNRLKSGQPANDKYKDSAVEAWDLKSPPKHFLDDVMLHVPVNETPSLFDSTVAVTTNGAQTEIALWRTAGRRPIVSHDDGITAFDRRGETLYLLSHKNAPTFQVLTLKLGAPLASAHVMLPARKDRVIETIHAAPDALYVVAREGIYSHLLRITDNGAAEDIVLPFKGDIHEAFTDARQPGVAFALEGWAIPTHHYVYDPATKRLTDPGLDTQPVMPTGEFSVSDIDATAKDGTKIPLTVISQAAPVKTPRLTILTAYGSYGISQLPHFSTAYTLFLREGGVRAVCHVRGGGELGEAWRLGGKDANKPNTWRDFIACGEELIARGITTRDKLFIFGGSGGAITVGRAMEERPDLFAGIIAAVPPANMVRLEFMPDGMLETQEFGSLKTEAGFRNLLADDSYQHVADGVRYPPILLTMGLNDPRIAPWQPAKLAARLLAAHHSVLLRVDLDNGHGIGATRAQGDALYADIFSFVFWHTGREGWSPVLR